MTATPTLPFRRPTTSFPCSFMNTIPQLPTCLSLKGQRAHQFVSPLSIHLFSNTQKQPSKSQPRPFGSSPVCSPTTSPLQQYAFDFRSTYHTLHAFRPYQGEQRLPKEPPSSTTVDIPSDTSSPLHGIPSIPPPTPSHNFDQSYQPALLSCPSILSSSERQHASLLPPFQRFDNFRGRRFSRSQPSILSIPKVGKGGCSLSPSSIAVDFSINTASLVHGIPLISPPVPSRNLDQHPASLHPHDFHQYLGSLFIQALLPLLSQSDDVLPCRLPFVNLKIAVGSNC